MSVSPISYLEPPIRKASDHVQIEHLSNYGHRAYLDAVEGAFGMEVDYAQLQKIYGAPTDAEQRRYTPAKCTGADMKVVSGSPDPITTPRKRTQ